MQNRLHLPLALSVPKVEGQPNEDSFQRSHRGIFALSDGASVSFDSASWSRILVRHYAQYPVFSPEWLSTAIVKFRKLYDRENLPWMKQAAYDRGSFASLLGVRFLDRGTLIQILAIGDSLAVLCDGNDVRATFPYSIASEFDQRPQLLCTNPDENLFVENDNFDCSRLVNWSFRGLERPALLCMTDALGQWLLAHDDRQAAISVIRQLRTKKQFKRFVYSEREAARMKRDDTTLLAIW